MTLGEIEHEVSRLQRQAELLRQSQSTGRVIVAWRKLQTCAMVDGSTLSEWYFCDANKRPAEKIMRGYGWQPLYAAGVEGIGS